MATASDGSQMQMRGGYCPAKYDTARSAKTESHDAAQVAKDMLSGAYVRAATRRGFTKARAEMVKDRPLRKDLGVITQHVNEVVHNLAWQEWLSDANRLLGNKLIDGAIREQYGPAVIRTLKDDLQGIATADVVSGTAIDQALMKLRANVSRATMGLSFTTALMQPFGITQSMVRIGAVPVLRGLAQWGGDAARMESSMTLDQREKRFHAAAREDLQSRAARDRWPGAGPEQDEPGDRRRLVLPHHQVPADCRRAHLDWALRADTGPGHGRGHGSGPC